MNLSREVLYQRHRLSHQQIDDYLDEQQHDLVLEEKISQLKQVALFMELTQSLNKANIWFISLKGPLLSYRIYGDATCRRFFDFDFLVHPNSVQKAITVFKEAGFKPQIYDWPTNKNLEKMVFLRYNQFALLHPGKGVLVEIHWRLFKYPVIRFEKIETIVANNLHQTAFAGQQFNQFSSEFELLHLIIHGGLHAWKDLKWLVDIYEIINRSSINEKRFESLVQLFKAQRMIGLCNRMLQHFFPDSLILSPQHSIPTWFFRFSLRQITKDRDLHPNHLFNFLKYAIYRMFSFPGWRYRFEALNLFSFSPRDLKKNQIPPYAFLYIMYRPLGYFYRSFKKIN